MQRFQRAPQFLCCRSLSRLTLTLHTTTAVISTRVNKYESVFSLLNPLRECYLQGKFLRFPQQRNVTDSLAHAQTPSPDFFSLKNSGTPRASFALEHTRITNLHLKGKDILVTCDVCFSVTELSVCVKRITICWPSVVRPGSKSS